MTGAGLANLDASVTRDFSDFKIVERANLQFRLEVFNVANHSNYSLIGRIVNHPTFGIVQNQLPPRQIQCGVKIGF